MHRRYTHTLIIWVIVLLLTACGSTKVNTAQSRFYQSFVTRFNVYHNGNEAYKEGLSAQEKSHKDNYMEIIPLFPVSKENTRSSGSGSFDKAIEKSQKAIKLHSIKQKPKKKAGRKLSEKDKLWYAKKEYNPYLHNAWMLMGKAQFQKGEFLEAASTFSYITRLYSEDPKIVAEARMRMAQCYAELEWNYEADNLLAQIGRDSIHYQLAEEYDAIMASHLLRQEQFAEALPYLEKAVKRSGRTKKQKTREYYLLGQIHKHLGNKQQAYEAFGKAIKQNPPYELEFNARIQQTETVSGNNAPKMLKTLKRMGKDPNNKDFLDQVHYAMGNIYLAQKDTVNAIAQYEKGAELSTRNGIEKGILLLQLGQIYWDRTKYVDAQRCYSEAIGLIDKEHKDYDMVNLRSTILDELVEHTVAIDLQDSLQHLATLPEAELDKVIENIIAEVIRQEEEAKKAEEEAALMAQREEALGAAQAKGPQMNTPSAMNTGDKSWYFYNTQLVAQGKKDFQQKWGRRKLEDNWRRANKSVLADETYEGVNYDDDEEEDMSTDSIASDSTAMALPDSLVTDPHDPMYYKQQIPFTEEQMIESNAILQEALFSAGIIYKDKLEDFRLAERTLRRLNTQFPDFDRTDEVYYNMYLMYSRWRRWDEAERYRQLLLTEYPYSDYTLTINDPDFATNAIYGKHIEDSLYAATYSAYMEGRHGEVESNVTLSGEKYPLGIHRPKFMFLNAMSDLQQGDQSSFLSQLKEIVGKYPQNEISELAGLIAQGMQEGRLLTSGTLGSIWSRRLASTEETIVADSLRQPFSSERYAPFRFVIAYEEGTVNENQLLFEVARYNFSKFMVRNFDISTSKHGGIGMLHVIGLASFDEAYQYMHRLYADPEMAVKLSGLRALLITDANLELLLKYYSIDEYTLFYEQNFTNLPLLEEEKSTLDEIIFE
ncbi:MAG: tetratricopeptide repeat protein [Bacteroidaceae bacterium]|nr:tetratricopeptide repeat protein [Bacteroidaceae bacterium]